MSFFSLQLLGSLLVFGTVILTHSLKMCRCAWSESLLVAALNELMVSWPASPNVLDSNNGYPVACPRMCARGPGVIPGGSTVVVCNM